jgi:hypothetical protein
MNECRVDDCDRAGFVIVNLDEEMLCMDHFNEPYDISYLNEPEESDN